MKQFYLLLLLALFSIAGCKKEDLRSSKWAIGTQVRSKQPDKVMKEPMYVMGYYDDTHKDFIQYWIRDANYEKLGYAYTVINDQLVKVADPKP